MQLSVHTYRNLPGLLANNERDRIGLFGQADRGTVAGSELLGKRGVVGQREQASRRGDALFLNDDRAVVQRRTWKENGLDELGADLRVRLNAPLRIGVERGLPLKGDQRPEVLRYSYDSRGASFCVKNTAFLVWRLFLLKHMTPFGKRTLNSI